MNTSGDRGVKSCKVHLVNLESILTFICGNLLQCFTFVLKLVRLVVCAKHCVPEEISVLMGRLLAQLVDSACGTFLQSWADAGSLVGLLGNIPFVDMWRYETLFILCIYIWGAVLSKLIDEYQLKQAFQNQICGFNFVFVTLLLFDKTFFEMVSVVKGGSFPLSFHKDIYWPPYWICCLIYSWQWHHAFLGLENGL